MDQNAKYKKIIIVRGGINAKETLLLFPIPKANYPQ